MFFDPEQHLPLLSCATCHGTGTVFWRSCRDCKGMSVGHFVRNRFLFWHYPLDRYHIAYDHSKLLANKVRKVAVALFGLNFWFWAGFVTYRAYEMLPVNSMTLADIPAGAQTLF